jgi:hypothetical protein
VDVYNFPQNRKNNTFQWADSLTHVRGRHIVTSGFDIRRTQIVSSVDRNSRPKVIFHGLRKPLEDPPIPMFRPDGSPIDQRVFSSTTLAALSVPTGVFQTLAVSPHESVDLRFTQYNFFFQDEYQIRPNFRVLAGLRYELNTVPKTAGHKLEQAFDRGMEFAREVQESDLLCDRLVAAATCSNLVNALQDLSFRVAFGGDRNNFGPRIGFAWDPRGDGKWAIRWGYGLYFDQFLGILINQSRNAFSDFVPVNTATLRGVYLYNLANPTLRGIAGQDVGGLEGNDLTNLVQANTLNTLNPASTLGGVINPVSSLLKTTLHTRPFIEDSFPLFPGLDLVLPASDLRSPYAHHYAANVQRQLSAQYVLSLSFVGTRGVKLLRTTTPDLGAHRSYLSLRPMEETFWANEFSPRGDLGPPTPTTNDLRFTTSRTFFESSASSTFNSFQIQIQKQYEKHFQFGNAFTYSHTMDDASDFFDNAGAFALPQNSFERSERGSANFDIRFRNVFNFVWDLPYLEKRKWFAGWQIAGIYTAQSGPAYTVNSSIDVNRDGNLTDRLNTTNGLVFGPFSDDSKQLLRIGSGVNPLDLLAPDGANGAVGRNTFRATGINNLDLVLNTKFILNGRHQLSFRTEVFNVFNRTHFAIPIRILEAPAFGMPVETTIPARMIQFALKLTF